MQTDAFFEPPLVEPTGAVPPEGLVVPEPLLRLALVFPDPLGRVELCPTVELVIAADDEPAALL